MRVKIMFLLFLLLHVLGVEAQQAATSQDTISFREDLGLIIIPITYNGVVKEFAFDTGAQRTVVFSWAKEELKPTSRTIYLKSSNSSMTKLPIYKSGKVSLGTKTITKHTSIMVEDSDIFSCYEVDGILGVDIIKHFNWTIDFEKKQLIRHDASYKPATGSSWYEMSLSFTNNTPIMHTLLRGKEVTFLLDTGASDCDLNTKSLSQESLRLFETQALYSGFYDVNGVLTPTKVSKAVTAHISKEVDLSIVVSLGTKKSKLGNSLWKGVSLFLSLSSETLYVSKKELEESTYSYDGGVVFKDGTISLMTIYEGSDAWLAGIRQGDEVVKINGKAFTEFCTLDQYQRSLSAASEDIYLTFTNGKELVFKKKKRFKDQD